MKISGAFRCDTLGGMGKETDDLIRRAERAIKLAEQTRRMHAKKSRRDSLGRIQDVKLARQRIAEVMEDLRPVIHWNASVAHWRVTADEYKVLRELSKALQRQRMKLHRFIPLEAWKEENED